MTSRPTRWWCLTVGLAASLLLVAGIPSAEAGRAKVTKWHHDSIYKFGFKYFEKFKPIPLQPNETDIICKFGDSKGAGSNRNVQDPTLEVYRMRIDGKSDEVVTGAKEAPKRPMFRPQGPTATNVWEMAFGDWTRPRPYDPRFKPLKLDRKKFKKFKTRKEKLESKLFRYTVEVPTWTGGKMEMYLALALFEKDGVQIGIYFTCPGVIMKDYVKPFESVAKSFIWADKKAEDVESHDELEDVNITDKRRRQIERSMVAGWDIIVSPKKNYIIIYNTKNGRNKLLAKTIAKRIEMIREQVYEVQFPPSKPIKAVSIVRVCADAREYHQYGGPGGSAGYWSPGTEELVFYDASRKEKIDDDTVSVLYHEAFHQYIFYSTGSVSPHSWFNEGHGDYYAGAKLRGKKFVIKPFQWRVGTVRRAITEGPREREGDLWGNKGYTPLKHLVQFTQGQYYSYPGVSYAQGWSLIYFLREIVPKKKKWNAKWGKILDTYFDVLKAEAAKNGGNPFRRVPDEDDSDDDLPDPFKEPEADDDEDPEAEEPEDLEDGDLEDGGFARPASFGRPNQKALEKALKQAFQGIDWEELEKAWLKNATG